MKEGLHKDLGREPNDAELASAAKISVTQMRRDIEVGRAARNKLIKVPLFICVLLSRNNLYYSNKHTLKTTTTTTTRRRNKVLYNSLCTMVEDGLARANKNVRTFLLSDRTS